MSVIPLAITGTVDILGRKVGTTLDTTGKLQNNPCVVVAELGLNHCGKIDVAVKMIKAAAECGVDIVKLQKRHLPSTYSTSAYRNPNGTAHALSHYLPILKECELAESDFKELKLIAEDLGLGFLVTPWDFPSVDLLESIGVEAYKVSSADFTNVFLHQYISKTKKPVIVSTGMSTEVEQFKIIPGLKETLKDRLVLMHSVSSYPTAFKDCQLHSILRMKVNHKVPVGWSGHERGVAVSVASAMLGADIIERHFTLDRTMPGPDQAASLEPDGLKKLVQRIRMSEEAYGQVESSRELNRGEVASREVLGKSLAARIDLNPGTIITREHLVSRSPGRGIPVYDYKKILGKKVNYAILKGELLVRESLTEVEHVKA